LRANSYSSVATGGKMTAPDFAGAGFSSVTVGNGDAAVEVDVGCASISSLAAWADGAPSGRACGKGTRAARPSRGMDCGGRRTWLSWNRLDRKFPALASATNAGPAPSKMRTTQAPVLAIMARLLPLAMAGGERFANSCSEERIIDYCGGNSPRFRRESFSKRMV
jgi:hypothetical protein